MSSQKYINLVIVHLLLGFLIYNLPILAKLYALIIPLIGIVYIIKNQNKNNEVLYVAAYITSVEVFLRMTQSSFINEYGKYIIIIILFIGLLYSGLKKGGFIFIFFILLLFPSVFVSVEALSHDVNFRKAIAFNLSGPVCLAVSAVYCYQREVTYKQLLNVFTSFGLPIICMMVYLFLYTPDLQEVVTSTGSNFDTSGGFGPNQVSTILGLGMFIFFTQALLNSKSKLVFILNVCFLIICSYRGVITFSRGGVYVGIIMIILLTYILFRNLNLKGKTKILFISVSALILASGIWTYSSLQTGGMIDKRYANQDAAGREKEGLLTGRETLMETELQMFMNNPILGVGVGKNREERIEMTGIEAASHNEITRLFAEHGMFGIAALLILIFVPLSLYPTNRENIFLLSFFVFWALTINHAAMRLAAPAFVYALSLLKVTFNEKNPPLHREQTL